MAENSAIEWTDHTFNGWIGCTKVGPGCDHCYAEQLATTRLQVPWGPGAPRRRTAASTWAKPRRWDRLAAAEGRRYRVFCSSLADVFDNEVPVEWRADLFALIRATPNLDWLLVTKRIGNAAKMAEAAGGWPSNVWLGATIVNQAEADRDIYKLRQTKYDAGLPVAFLSMEPLLGPVDIRKHLWPAHGWWKGPHRSYEEAKAAGAECGMKPQALLSEAVARSLVNWVIVGGESGPGARPMHPDWARSLRDQCAAAGVPFLFKQWGEWLPWEPDVLPYFQSQAGELIDRHVLPDFNDADLKGWTDALMYEGNDVVVHQRVGKARAGRLLDGVQHDGYPASSGGRPEAAPVTDLDAPAPVRAGVSAPKAALSKRALAAAKPETQQP